MTTNCSEHKNVKENIIKTTNLQYTPEPGGMGKAFFSKMANNGDAIAQIDGVTGERDSYNSLLRRCVLTAVAMRSRGVQKGDIITICSINHLNSCVPFIASLFLGAIPANLDPSISLTDTVHLLKQINPKLIFISVEAVELIENSLGKLGSNPEIVFFGNSTKHTEFTEFLKESPEEINFKPVEIANLKETAVIFFSSGTTGLPKGICLHHYGLMYHSYLFADMGFNTEVCQVFSSMYWISAVLLLGATVLSKGARVIVPKYAPDLVWDLVIKYKTTLMFLAPTQAIAMYKKGRPKEANLSHFSHLLVAGGPMPTDFLEAFRKILPETKVLLGYAQTELAGATTCFQPKKVEDMIMAYQKLGSSGKPVPGLTYKIANPDTEEILGPNETGELRVKSNLYMNGYYNIDSSSAFDRDGFVKTGDIAYYDEDYCFYIVDRIKEMLKFQSWHVPPAKLEGILLTHPAVDAAVVIGLPHPEDGDHPMGLVVLKKGFVGNVNSDEIEKYADERITDDRHKLRGGVKIIEKIPLTPTGKLRRNEVRDMVIRGII